MNRRSWTILSLMLVMIAGIMVIGLQFAQAAEEEAPPVDPAAATEAEAPPADEDAAKAEETTEETTERKKVKTSVLDTINKGGMIGYIIIGLSFVALSLIIEHAVTIRRDKLCPPELANELEDYFNEEQYEEALELCNVEQNMLTEVVRAGLSRIDSGYERMQEAMQEAGAEAAVGLQQKISYLSLIGNISPMLGLLGTVAGMVGAFGTIASMTVVKPAMLAKDINTALVTTLLGLTVAIPVMCAYQFFTNRVTRIILEASTIVSDLMERFKPAK